MTEIHEVQDTYPSQALDSNRGKRYVLLGLGLNAVIWTAALLFIQVRPTAYSSKWAIDIPSSRSTSYISLPDIGQASSSVSNPYDISDPRQSYKYIAQSSEVSEQAAQKLGLPVRELKKVRIKVVDNTTLMEFEMRGRTPEEAQRKALAFQEALEEKLDDLRRAEITRQDENLETTLNSAERKLTAAQLRVLNYKNQLGLTSNDQLRDSTVNIETLRRHRAEAIAELQEVGAAYARLSSNLGLSAQQANDSFVLQSSPLFQEYLVNYAKAKAELAQLSSMYSPSSPQVLYKQDEVETTRAAILYQGQLLLGKPLSLTTLEQQNLINSNSSPERAQLFKELISFQSKQQGLQGRIQGLDQQIASLESRLKVLSTQYSQLDNLERNSKVAEAIFSSTLAKLDLTKSSTPTAYPEFSTLNPPKLPDEPNGPSNKLILAGTFTSSLFLTMGVVMLWMRESKRQKFPRIRNTKELQVYDSRNAKI